MLDSLEPAAVDLWQAFRQIEPDPELRTIEILKRGFAALVNAWGGKIEPDWLDPAKDKPAQETPLSPAQAAAAFKQAWK